MESIDLNTEEGKAIDAVNVWLSKAHGAEYGFMLAAYASFEQFAKGNRDPLAKLLTVVNGKKAKRIKRVEGEKLAFAAPLRRLVAHCLPNVSAKYNGASDFGVAWTVATGTNDLTDTVMMEKLEAFTLEENRISPFSKTFKEHFPPIAATPKQKAQAELIKAKVKALNKWLEENDITKEVLFHAFDAK